jgi:hypothetical protein
MKLFRKKKQNNDTTERYNKLALRQLRFEKALNDEAWRLEKQRNNGKDYVR